MRKKGILESFPVPNEMTPGLKPHEELEGIYTFVREPRDANVTVYEPTNGLGLRRSYILSWWEFERFLKLILNMPERHATRASDLLWNFYRVTVTIPGWAVEVLRSKKEYEALFMEVK